MSSVRSHNPVKGTTAIYYRISTDDQTLDMQKHAIESFTEEHKLAGPFVTYQDIGVSGSNNKRQGFMCLLDDCEKGKIKRLIVYKLDRLTRDALTGIRTVIRLDELGVEFISVSQPMFRPGTPMRRAMIAIFAELAEMERDTIRERVIAGLDAARRRGVILGAKKKLTPEQDDEMLAMRKSGMGMRKIALALGVSVGTVHKTLKERSSQPDG